MSDREPIAAIWAGHPFWKCSQCAYDAPEERMVREHMQWAHPLDPELPVLVSASTKKGKVTDGATDANQDS